MAEKKQSITLSNMPIKEDEDLDFIPIRAAAKRRQAGLFSHILLITIASFFVIFLIWAHFTQLDEVTRGAGKVIPSKRIQRVNNLEGGIISEIFVHGGDFVEKGQILLKINNVLAESDLQDIQKRIISLTLKELRLTAELNDEPLKFPAELVQKNPTIAEAEERAFLVKRNKLQQELDVLHEQIKQKEQAVKEIKQKIIHLEKSEKLAKEQIELTRPLANSGAISRVELIQRERDYNDIKSQLDAARLSLPRIEAALKEAQERIDEQIANDRDKVSSELSKVRLELQSLKEKVRANKDRVLRTDVRSPVNGIVKQLLVNTIGGVVQPGEDLVEIVPIDDTLTIEAEIKPSDIAFLRPGLEATVKITAYDFSIYGGLKAKVSDISADTIQDKKGNEFYHVKLITDTNHLTRNGKKLPIIPGMTATVDILTGKKSVLDYLLKPILKARYSALTER